VVAGPDKEVLALLEHLAKSGALERFSQRSTSIVLSASPQSDSRILLRQVWIRQDLARAGAGHTVCSVCRSRRGIQPGREAGLPEMPTGVANGSQDFTSLGVLRKCRDCGEVFGHPAIKWRCLKCGTVVPEDKVMEVDAYTYALTKNEENAAWCCPLR